MTVKSKNVPWMTWMNNPNRSSCFGHTGKATVNNRQLVASEVKFFCEAGWPGWQQQQCRIFFPVKLISWKRTASTCLVIISLYGQANGKMQKRDNMWCSRPAWLDKLTWEKIIIILPFSLIFEVYETLNHCCVLFSHKFLFVYIFVKKKCLFYRYF